MPGLYSHTTRATGATLTAAIYNSDHQNHIDNEIPTMMDDYSATVGEMQTTADPGEVGTESLATSLAGELERLRFAIKDAKTAIGLTSAQWYTTPTGSVSAAFGGASTGDLKPTLKTTADSGWIMLDDGTIGNASSGGTTRANADTESLFTLLWNNTADAQCAVSGGRGANAAADYAANKTIALPKVLGRALGAAGAGSGLTSRVLALATGTETHTLTQAQTPVKSHSHGPGTLSTDTQGDHAHQEQVGSGAGQTGAVTGARAVTAGGSAITTIANGGAGTDYTDAGALNTANGGSHAHTVTAGSTAAASDATADAHPIVQPTSFVNWMVKL